MLTYETMQLIDDLMSFEAPPQVFICEAGLALPTDAPGEAGWSGCVVVSWRPLIDLSFGIDEQPLAA